MKFKAVLFTFVLLNTSCDILKSKEERIVGNISVIDSNDEEGGRYHLIFYNDKKEFNSNIVDDFVEDIIGDNSVLMVKCIDKLNCQVVYYKVLHSEGKSVHETIKVNFKTYSQAKVSFSSPAYKFHTNKIKCP